MPFKTHSEGGSWSGGGTQVSNCSDSQQRAIRAAFDNVHSFGVGCLNRLPGMEALATCLAGKTVDSMTIDCNGPGCTPESLHGADAARGGNDINICAGAFTSDLNSSLFHELIHSCNGLEIDAYALGIHCYQDRGVIPVIQSGVLNSDFQRETRDVGGGLRAGTFVVWDPTTGNVYVKVETGGAWNSGPTVSRGAELTGVHGLFRI
jgi:hypothetical protein